ncbi:hypothetical protein Zmor_027537 [Zophobas morio]|uniref:Uncharacterized protein n=1 Tax=Zophobas morio TaxID=2755281 RepID=A0AA38HP34_9CUCU|nr:hypothetical protein Zmor_027537 [Zophobas morio]
MFLKSRDFKRLKLATRDERVSQGYREGPLLFAQSPPRRRPRRCPQKPSLALFLSNRRPAFQICEKPITPRRYSRPSLIPSENPDFPD